MKIPDSPLSQSITSHSSDPTIIKESDYYTYHSRPCLSYFKKGVFSMQEGHVLKYRRACSQIQKGPFFFFNTHALHSCGAKQIYIKIKYSSPSHAFHSPTRFLSTPTPLSFRPQPTLPSPLLLELVHLLPCLLSPPTCSLVHSSTRQLTMLLIELVHLLPCLFLHTTCSLVSPSTRQFTMLLIELVHLLPCLLIQLTCSLVHSLIRLLVNYFYHLTFLSVLV